MTLGSHEALPINIWVKFINTIKTAGEKVSPTSVVEACVGKYSESFDVSNN